MIRSKLKQPKQKPEDDLYSEYIRKRAIMRVGGCERRHALKFDVELDSGRIRPAWKSLDCAHLISRRYHGTAWDIDNALGLCGSCHMNIDSMDQKSIFIVGKIGRKQYELLLIRKAGVHHIDKAALILYLKRQIEKLKYEAPWRE